MLISASAQTKKGTIEQGSTRIKSQLSAQTHPQRIVAPRSLSRVCNSFSLHQSSSSSLICRQPTLTVTAMKPLLVIYPWWTQPVVEHRSRSKRSSGWLKSEFANRSTCTNSNFTQQMASRGTTVATTCESHNFIDECIYMCMPNTFLNR